MAGLGRYFFYRKEVWKTTWTFRLCLLFFLAAVALLTRSFLADDIGESLVCNERVDPSGAILVENFDADYLLFERAAALKNAGIASKVLVTVSGTPDLEQSEASSNGVVEVFSKIARLSNPTTIPARLVEPITLNVAKDVRDYLLREHINSVVIVTAGFRSQRSVLVYEKILTPAGIKFGCVPVFGEQTPDNWIRHWHGVQDVVLQFGKLQYYRFYVLMRE